MKKVKSTKFFFISILVIIIFLQTKLGATIYGSISGKVIGEDTGKEIKGSKIILYTLDGELIASTETDKNGFFQFKMLKEGNYSLQFKPLAPYLLSPYRDKTRKERLQEGKIALGKGQNIYIEKSLKAGGTISGYVYREDGKTPIEGASIEAYPADKLWDIPCFATSDSNGKYSITDLIPLNNYIVTAAQLGPISHIPIGKREVKVEANKNTELNFIFNIIDPTRINGRVLSGVDGNPLPSADVLLLKYNNETNSFIGIFGFHINEEGKFSIIGLETGIYKIKAEDYNLEIQRGDEKEIEVYIEKGQTKEITLFLDLPSIKTIS